MNFKNIFIIFVGLIILITINYIFFTNETVDITHFGDDHLNSENVTHKEENKEHKDLNHIDNKNIKEPNNTDTENNKNNKIEDKINPEDIINFNEIKEQNKIKIGVMTIPGTKVRDFMVGNNKISFEPVKKTFQNMKELFPHMSTYETIYNFNIRNKTKEMDYDFECYREDMVLSFPFYELGKQFDLDKYDYIFIPELGMKFTEEIVNDIYENIIYSRKTFKDVCFYQVTPYNTMKVKKQKTKTDFNLLTVNYPETRFKEFGSILLRPQTLRILEYFGNGLYHIDRFDRNLQVYCDIGDLKIVVFPRK